MNEKEAWEAAANLQVAIAPIMGVYRQLREDMPEDIAGEAFTFFLDMIRVEHEKEIEQLRLQTARAYKEKS